MPGFRRTQQGVHSNEYRASILSFKIAKPRNRFSELVGNQVIIARSSQHRKQGIFNLKKIEMPEIRSSELVHSQ